MTSQVNHSPMSMPPFFILLSKIVSSRPSVMMSTLLTNIRMHQKHDSKKNMIHQTTSLGGVLPMGNDDTPLIPIAIHQMELTTTISTIILVENMTSRSPTLSAGGRIHKQCIRGYRKSLIMSWLRLPLLLALRGNSASLEGS